MHTLHLQKMPCSSATCRSQNNSSCGRTFPMMRSIQCMHYDIQQHAKRCLFSLPRIAPSRNGAVQPSASSQVSGIMCVEIHDIRAVCIGYEIILVFVLHVCGENIF